MANLTYLTGAGVAAGVTAATCAGLYLAGPSGRALAQKQRPKKIQPTGGAVYRWCAAVSLLAFCVLGSYVLTVAFRGLTGIPLPWFAASAALAVLLRRTTEMTDEEFPEWESILCSGFMLCVPLVMGVMT